jgi:hypothetical protein
MSIKRIAKTWKRGKEKPFTDDEQHRRPTMAWRPGSDGKGASECVGQC